MGKFTKDFLIKAGKRALHAFAQSALGMITIGLPIGEIDWKYILAVSATATVYSLLKSIVIGIPEADEEPVNE